MNSTIQKLIFSLLLSSSLSLSLCACESTRLPGIYRMDVRQGNDISEATLSRLRVGMNKLQVQELFGSPAIMHVLNKDRWDYYYSFDPGIDRGLDPVERHLSIYFKNDKVVRWD